MAKSMFFNGDVVYSNKRYPGQSTEGRVIGYVSGGRHVRVEWADGSIADYLPMKLKNYTSAPTLPLYRLPVS